MTRLCFHSILCVVFLTLAAHAQQAGNTAPTAPDQSGTPIDVPDIIIKGSATIKLMATSFSKQGPSNTRVLTKSELDSLNPLEKQAPLLLARSAAPGAMPERLNYKALVSLSMGMFQTPDFLFAYGSSFSQYAFFAQADYHSSSGYSTNTDFQNGALHMDLRYKEHEGDGLFAGSVTTSSVDLGLRGYSLFGRIDSLVTRKQQNMALKIHMINRENNYPFEATIGLATSNLSESSTTNNSLRETALQGALSVEHAMWGWHPAVYTRLDIRPTGSHTLSDNEIGLRLRNRDSSYHLQAEAAIHTVTNSQNQLSADIAARAQVSVPLSSSLDFIGSVRHDIEATFLSTTLEHVPYLNLASDLSTQWTTVEFLAGLHYSPNTSLEVGASLLYASLSQMAFIEIDSQRSFLLHYQPGLRIRIAGDVLWHINSRSSLTASLHVNHEQLTSSGALPYTAPVEVSLNYHCTITDRLLSEVHLSYVGSRKVSSTRDESLSAYLLLNASLRYMLAETLSITGRVENLTNSSIFVFEKYRERGAFASLGLEWKF